MACGPPGCQHGFSTVFPGSLLFPVLVGRRRRGRSGHGRRSWVRGAVDLVGDLDAVVAEPAGYLGDRDALCQGEAAGSAARLPHATDPRYAGKASRALLRASGLRVGTIQVGLSRGWIRREKRPSLKLL